MTAHATTTRTTAQEGITVPRHRTHIIRRFIAHHLITTSLAVSAFAYLVITLIVRPL